MSGQDECQLLSRIASDTDSSTDISESEQDVNSETMMFNTVEKKFTNNDKCHLKVIVNVNLE